MTALLYMLELRTFTITLCGSVALSLCVTLFFAPLQLGVFALSFLFFCCAFPLNNNHNSKGCGGGRQQGTSRQALLRNCCAEGRKCTQ